MHAPAWIDVEDTQELVATGWVGVAPDGGEESRHVDVGPDYGVEDPFRAEIRNTFETLEERVDA